VTPFVWDHHIPLSTYEDYARASWPAEDLSTITVERDLFGLDSTRKRPSERSNRRL
jgi:hypothetical protein